MARVTMVEAVSMALSWELENDESVVIMGEDVGINGGVFRSTIGLQEKFGTKRVIDTPLAEGMIAGLAIGMSAMGMKPVIEAQFMGFIYPMVEQLTCHAARMRHRTRGRLSCPMVLRAPFGGGVHAPEHHSESTEAMFAHVPGLRVVIPSSAARTYGLLLAAIRDPDPVVFLEPKRLYRLNKEEVEDNGEDLPLDVCFVLRGGSDITLVSWGAMIKETLESADKLAQQGISAEVIDVATISPLDMNTIIESVEKTGRCVIIHEAARMCGVGAEIAAGLADAGLYHLDAPVKRVTGYDSIMPLYKMEMKYMPGVKRIMKAVNEVMEAS
jgi:2-oxoisovalerate dehydrogenase E1 component beta subunit